MANQEDFMTLKELLCGISYVVIKGNDEIPISDIVYDSRKTVENCAFVCISGTITDGHRFLREAEQKGVSAIVMEHLPIQLTEIHLNHMTIVLTEDSKKALACMSANYFAHPDREMMVIGITGTKGKTTTAHMIKAILEADGRKTGMIGTMGSYIGSQKIPLLHTTPPSYEVYRLLRQMAEEGCKYVVMEVSSQGLKLSRVWGIQFAAGIFTNISTDHIGVGEHRNFEEYLYWKCRLFCKCEVGIINQDETFHEKMEEGHFIPFLHFGMESNADFYFDTIKQEKRNGFLGLSCNLKGRVSFSCEIGMPGRFNAYNALAAIAAAIYFDCSPSAICDALFNIRVKGRTELIPVNGDYHLMIDYAHNAVSLESLLKMLRSYEPGRIVCLFGCGGNRSRYRRYAMGKISGQYADFSILTEDNSREEPLMEIIKDIIEGMHQTNGEYIVIPSREDAIYYSIKYALPGDMIVLAGKGHEDYMEQNGHRIHFSEHEIVQKILKRIANEPERNQ